jgi:hypothetical protein
VLRYDQVKFGASEKCEKRPTKQSLRFGSGSAEGLLCGPNVCVISAIGTGMFAVLEKVLDMIYLSGVHSTIQTVV